MILPFVLFSYWRVSPAGIPIGAVFMYAWYVTRDTKEVPSHIFFQAGIAFFAVGVLMTIFWIARNTGGEEQ